MSASSVELQGPLPAAAAAPAPSAVQSRGSVSGLLAARARGVRGRAVTVAVATAVIVLSFNSGTFEVTSRNPVGIGIWWAIVLGVGTLLWPRARTPRAALVAGGLLAALAALTLLSMRWAPSAEDAFTEFGRVTLYAGVFLLVVLAARRGSVRLWSDGLAIGIAAIGVLALTVRLFPHLIPSANQSPFFPGDPRPSYPLGYWNGLASMLAIGIPLLLRSATNSESRVARALAIAPIPAIAAVIDLTSSRGGALAAVVGIGVFVALTRDRLRSVSALVVAAAASGAVVAVLSSRPTLKHGPIGSATALSEGRSAALLIGLACLLAAAGWILAERFAPTRGPLLSTAWKRTLAAAAVAVTAVGIVASHPAQRFDSFKQPPGVNDSPLASTQGNGRWQLWEAAVNEFVAHPVGGGGAGSFGSWWSAHASINYFARDAHSQYLQSLAELGVGGLALLLGLLAVAAATAKRRVARARHGERPAVAAVTAAFFAFAVAAGIDWMWQLTVVGMIGIGLLAVLTGPASVVARRTRPDPVDDPRTRFSFERLSLVLLGLALMAALAVPYAAAKLVEDSQHSVGAGNLAAAASSADQARHLQPWAASPDLQLALVRESQGRLDDASNLIGNAIDKSPSDWRLWVVSSQIDTKAGWAGAARTDLARARSLNPRSPYFTESASTQQGAGG